MTKGPVRMGLAFFVSGAELASRAAALELAVVVNYHLVVAAAGQARPSCWGSR